MRSVALLLAVLAACDQGAPLPAPPPAPVRTTPEPAPPPAPPAPPPAPPAPPPAPPVPAPRPHTQSRRHATLNDPLPAHGIVLHEYGLGGDDLVAIDTDAKTVHFVEHTIAADRKPTDTTRALGDAAVARFTALADAAWRETPVGDTPRLTDVRTYLEIADGDDVFVVDGTVFEPPWRPAAGRLVDAIASVSWARKAY